MPAPGTPPCADAPLRYLVDRREIGYLSALFECYDHLGAVRTVDPERAVVEVLCTADFQADVRALMADLQACDIPSLTPLPEP